MAAGRALLDRTIAGKGARAAAVASSSAGEPAQRWRRAEPVVTRRERAGARSPAAIATRPTGPPRALGGSDHDQVGSGAREIGGDGTVGGAGGCVDRMSGAAQANLPPYSRSITMLPYPAFVTDSYVAESIFCELTLTL